MAIYSNLTVDQGSDFSTQIVVEDSDGTNIIEVVVGKL